MLKECKARTLDLGIIKKTNRIYKNMLSAAVGDLGRITTAVSAQSSGMVHPSGAAEDASRPVKGFQAFGGFVCISLPWTRVAKNGRKLDVSLTISPIRDDQGRLVGASTIARDITEQKTAEVALRKAEKLALAGRMAATVAHEINNPLEAVSNVLYLLRNAVELSRDARKYVDIAYEELKRATEITKLTLGMQRSSDRSESVQVNSLLENVLTLYQRKVTILGIEIDRRYSDEGTVVGIPGELRQVFSNLIVNAMDALAASGDKLVLRVRRLRRWDTGEQGVRVSIVDNGPGIAPEHRLQLFQAFFTTKGEQGTGIGLWVSRTIVRKHGGTMRLHSSVRPGHSGTCFSVFLPLGEVARR